MNKYQEAFKAIADHFNSRGGGGLARIHLLKQVKTINELVELATPKKIIVGDEEELFCPNCKTNYRIMTFSGECAPNYENPFCGECGQALDWEDERW